MAGRAQRPKVQGPSTQWIDDQAIQEIAKDPQNRVMRYVEGSLPEGVQHQDPMDTYFMVNAYVEFAKKLTLMYPELEEKRKKAKKLKFDGDDYEGDRLMNELRDDMKRRIANEFKIVYGDPDNPEHILRMKQHEHFVKYMPYLVNMVCMPNQDPKMLAFVYEMILEKVKEKNTKGKYAGKTDQDIMLHAIELCKRDPTPAEKKKIAEGSIPCIPEHAFPGLSRGGSTATRGKMGRVRGRDPHKRY